MLAVEAEGFLVEGLQHQLHAFLEHLPVFLGVEQRAAEGFHLAGVIAAADAHDHPPAGDDVGHRVVLGEAQRMPHRQHVEAAAEFQSFRLRGEPEAKLDQVRQALIAFVLEVVLGGPQRVVAGFVHHAGDAARGPEHLGEAIVGIAAVVGGRALETDIVEVDLPDIQDVEAFDHLGIPLSFLPGRCPDLVNLIHSELIDGFRWPQGVAGAAYRTSGFPATATTRRGATGAAGIALRSIAGISTPISFNTALASSL